MSFDDQKGMSLAFEQAKKSYSEGGIPIGGALIHKDGTVLAVGHNQRVQKGSATLHGEIDTFEKAGRLRGSVYADCTIYTTLSPCNMCTGAILLFGVKRVVMGENNTFVGGEDLLKERGVEVINLKSQECEDILRKFITEHPEQWDEDIGK